MEFGNALEFSTCYIIYHKHWKENKTYLGAFGENGEDVATADAKGPGKEAPVMNNAMSVACVKSQS